MYDPGKGIFGDVSGSLHNIPMHMQDNGRVAQQIPTMGQVQIHNPAIHMSNAQLQQGMTAYSQEVGIGTTGPMGHYQTKIHNAAMYSTLAAEKRARSNRDNIQSMKNLSGAAQIGLGLLALTPVGAAAGIASVGLMAADYFLDDSEAYYRGFQNRMSDIRGIQNVMQNTGPAMVNSLTGRASERAAMSYLSQMSSISSDIGVTSGDLHGINTMAAQSGLFQGHGGSVGQLSSRLRQVAKLTKQIMDVGAGISAQDAIEIQRISQELDINTSKMGSMDIGKRLISAAKLSGRSVADMGQVMAAGAQISSQFGLGSAVGADIALFNDAFVSTSYAGLSAAARRKVGSQAQFSATLNAAHSRFAASISNSLVGQSMFVDPNTGELRIDDGDASIFQVGRKAELQANARMRRLYTGEAGTRLSQAGVSSKYIKSALSLQSQELAQQAAEGMDPEKRMELMLREAMVESQRLNIDPRAFLIQRHGKAAADAIMIQANEFQDSASSRALDNYKMNLEYHAAAAAASLPTKVAVSRSEKIGRVTANIEAEVRERATEEAMGIFRTGTAATRHLGIMDVEVGGNFGSGIRTGVRTRATLYNSYRGASGLLDALKDESGSDYLDAYRSSTSQSEHLDESLVGKYLIERGKDHDNFFDVGIQRGIQTTLLDAFNEDVSSLNSSDVLRIRRDLQITDPDIALDIGIIDEARRGGYTIGEMASSRNVSAKLRSRLKALDPDKKVDGTLAAQLLAGEIAFQDKQAANMYDEVKNNATEALKEANLTSEQIRRVNRAVNIFNNQRSDLRSTQVGTMSEVRESLRRAGFTAAEIQDESLQRAFMARGFKDSTGRTQQHMSEMFTATRKIGGVFGAEQFEPFEVSSLGASTNLFVEVQKQAKEKFGSTIIGDISEGMLVQGAINREAKRRGMARTRVELLFDTDTDINNITQQQAEERLLELGELASVAGGDEALMSVTGLLSGFGSNAEDALDQALASQGLDAKTKKVLRKLRYSKNPNVLGALGRLIKNKGNITGDLRVLLSQARGVKRTGALRNVIASLENTGFSGLLGSNEKQASDIINNLGSTEVAENAFNAFTTEGVDAALGTFGLKVSELDEKQQQQVRDLFESTVGAGGAGEVGKFQKELFKIIDAAGKTGGKTGGRTAESATLETVRHFNAMVAATATLLSALGDGEKGVAKLKSAQQMLTDLAAKAQTT